ncbi:poly(U)-binding-splicing factor PUF60-like [Artemia franciscana]|uniref:RRM domain-containing protein n=1 Tax=Artemia franciscana TaxID=6661 RepID=A0AA88I9J8_ARTSF|nr:hypothetical protein QYM36_003228 [Artemia franciscana]
MSFSYPYPQGFSRTMAGHQPPIPSVPPLPNMGVPAPIGHTPPLPIANIGIPPPPINVQAPPPTHPQYPTLGYQRPLSFQATQPPLPTTISQPPISMLPQVGLPPRIPNDSVKPPAVQLTTPPPVVANQGVRMVSGSLAVGPGLVMPTSTAAVPSGELAASPGFLATTVATAPPTGTPTAVAPTLPGTAPVLVAPQVPVVIPTLTDEPYIPDIPEYEVPAKLEQIGQVYPGPGARPELAASMVLANVKLGKDEKDTIARAKKYAMEQTIKMVLMKQTIAHQQLQARSLQRHQALVLMCRVYIGSIAFDLKEDTIRNAFAPFGPIKAINMSWDPVTQKHKGFAFVEYELPEAAQLALEQMNGAVMAGRNIKVGRPSNMPQAQSIIDEINEESKSLNRIYIASVHPDLTEDDIKGVFEAFGKIISSRLAPAPGSGNKHKGFGFIEYETTQAAHDAIASMNLFDLGGQYLRVGRAIVPPTGGAIAPPSGQALPTAVALAAAAATASVQAAEAVKSVVAPPVQAVAPVVITPTIPTVPIVATTGYAVPPPGIAVPTVAGLSPGVVIPRVGVPASTVATPISGSYAQPAVGAAIPPPAVVTPLSVGSTTIVQPVQPPTPAPLVDDRKRKLQEELEALHQAELKKKLVLDSEAVTLEQQENLSVRGTTARHLVMQRLMRQQPESFVVVLRNMVGPEDVDEYLQEEITEECSKYGNVQNVIIYQERQSEEEDAEVIVKIFVEFAAPTQAQMAKNALNGRFFGGRTVKADIYDQDLYDQNELSG